MGVLGILGVKPRPTPQLMDTRIAGISAEAKIANQVYCGVEADDPIGTLFVLVDLKIRNDRKDPVIIARQPPDPAGYRVARSLEDAQNGVFAYGLGGFEIYSDADLLTMPKLVLSPSPSSEQFARLQPGESHQASITIGILVNKRGDHLLEGAVPAGSSYLLKFDVLLWPFRSSSELEILEARKRWQDYGDLVVGSTPADLILFGAPDFQTLNRCLQPPWRVVK